jgi:hypothetical protein
MAKTEPAYQIVARAQANRIIAAATSVFERGDDTATVPLNEPWPGDALTFGVLKGCVFGLVEDHWPGSVECKYHSAKTHYVTVRLLPHVKDAWFDKYLAAQKRKWIASVIASAEAQFNDGHWVATVLAVPPTARLNTHEAFMEVCRGVRAQWSLMVACELERDEHGNAVFKVYDNDIQWHGFITGER